MRFCRKAKIEAREFRIVKRTNCTPQQLREEAQQRYWPLYGADHKETL